MNEVLREGWGLQQGQMDSKIHQDQRRSTNTDSCSRHKPKQDVSVSLRHPVWVIDDTPLLLLLLPAIIYCSHSSERRLCNRAYLFQSPDVAVDSLGSRRPSHARVVRHSQLSAPQFPIRPGCADASCWSASRERHGGHTHGVHDHPPSHKQRSSLILRSLRAGR